jgi:hypothetical protein
VVGPSQRRGALHDQAVIGPIRRGQQHPPHGRVERADLVKKPEDVPGQRVSQDQRERLARPAPLAQVLGRLIGRITRRHPVVRPVATPELLDEEAPRLTIRVNDKNVRSHHRHALEMLKPYLASAPT